MRSKYHLRPKGITHCQKCGKELTRQQRGNRQLYCGKECSGQKPAETYICKGCGIEFKAWRDRSTYCSKACSGKHIGQERKLKRDHWPNKCCKIHYKTCEICGKTFIVGGLGCMSRNTCNDECKRKLRTKQARHNRRKYEGYKIHIKNCIICKKTFKTFKTLQKTCGKKCSYRLMRINHNSGYNHRRTKLNVLKVFNDSAGRCGLCNRKLNLTRKVPHPLAATIDHIEPLSSGGEDEYYNSQLACFICNSTKSNKTTKNGEQRKLAVNM